MSEQATGGTYRADIDGLRAVSIILVVLFHAGVPAFGGGYIGVDVFFVISGFLITGLLIDEIGRSGTVSISSFYARRARRILPISTLVLLVTIAVGALVLSPIDRGSLVEDARAAALFVANWSFIDQAGDYFAGGFDHSLLLHYWSLAIEEQFYLFWPWLLIAATKLAPRRLDAQLRICRITLAVVGGGSLVASILFTDTLGVGAYYGTHLRIWELTAGAALALGRTGLNRVPLGIRDAASGVGIVLIVIAATTFSGATVFPGAAAMVPVAGSALVVAGGIPGPTRLGRMLALRPLPGLGKVSYAWYLWHWPALAVARILQVEHGWSVPTGVTAAIAVGVSLLLAVATHVLVERPIRFARVLVARPRRTLAFGLTLILVPVAMGAALPQGTNEAVAAPGHQRQGPTFSMTPQEARDDDPDTEVGGCHVGFAGTSAQAGCRFGHRNGRQTVVLIGDSHAVQWFPALDGAARRNGWKLHSWTKVNCPVFDLRIHLEQLDREYVECARWREEMLSRLQDLGGIDLLVIGRAGGSRQKVITDTGPTDDADAMHYREAARSGFAAFERLASRIVILRDTPYAPMDPPGCLSRNPGDPAACAFPFAEAVRADETRFRAEQAVATERVSFLDMTKWICVLEPCRVVNAHGIVLFRDTNHLTATFSRWLAPKMATLLGALL